MKQEDNLHDTLEINWMCFCNILKSHCNGPYRSVSKPCFCGAWGGCKYQIFLKHSEVVCILFFVVSFVFVMLLVGCFFLKGKSKFHVTCTWIILSKIFFLKCDRIAAFHITHSPPIFLSFPLLQYMLHFWNAKKAPVKQNDFIWAGT